MNGISSVGSFDSYSKISSGYKIQKAADGAAESAIIEKQDAQTKGLDKASQNIKNDQSLLNTADGAMSDIASNLERMRELAVQASNSAILTDDDIKSIQSEIDGIKKGIADTASQTEFNTKSLLDGSFTGNAQVGPNEGQSQQVNIGTATLQALGIDDFDVTGDFSIETIDNALSKIADSQSQVGAQKNGFDYMAAYNQTASINLQAATSKIEDTDIASMVSEKKKQDLLNTYSIMMQKQKQEAEEQKQKSFMTLF